MRSVFRRTPRALRFSRHGSRMANGRRARRDISSSCSLTRTTSSSNTSRSTRATPSARCSRASRGISKPTPIASTTRFTAEMRWAKARNRRTRSVAGLTRGGGSGKPPSPSSPSTHEKRSFESVHSSSSRRTGPRSRRSNGTIDVSVCPKPCSPTSSRGRSLSSSAFAKSVGRSRALSATSSVNAKRSAGSSTTAASVSTVGSGTGAVACRLSLAVSAVSSFVPV